MTIDTHSDPSLAYTYRGFTGPQPPTPAAEQAAPWRRPKLLALLGSACVMGLILGLWATPQLGVTENARTPMQPVSAQHLEGDMQIVVDPGAPQPMATTPGRLEVLPADMAIAAGEARRIAVQSRPPPRISIPEREAPPPSTTDLSEADGPYGEQQDGRSIRDAARATPDTGIYDERMEESEPMPDDAWG